MFCEYTVMQNCKDFLACLLWFVWEPIYLLPRWWNGKGFVKTGLIIKLNKILKFIAFGFISFHFHSLIVQYGKEFCRWSSYFESYFNRFRVQRLILHTTYASFTRCSAPIHRSVMLMMMMFIKTCAIFDRIVTYH